MSVLLDASQMYASVATGSNYNTRHPENNAIPVHLPDHDAEQGAATIRAVDDGNPGLLEAGDIISFTITIGGDTYVVDRAVVGQSRDGAEASGEPAQRGHLTETGTDQNGKNVALLLSQGPFQERHSPFFVNDTQFGGHGGDDVFLKAICYARVTRVETDDGPARVEDLRRGDRVRVLGGGSARLRWVGRQVIRARNGRDAGQGDTRLVRFPRGAFGNREAVFVTMQHRLALALGGEAALIKAKFLAEQGIGGCCFVDDGRPVEIYHLLTTRHEVIDICGMWSETFQPGLYSLSQMPAAMRQEIFEHFPRLRRAWDRGRFETGDPYPSALPMASRARFRREAGALGLLAPVVAPLAIAAE